MNKQELIASMTEKTGLSKKDTVEETLSKGDKIQLVGFGSFEIRNRAARTGKNPLTGEEMNIPAAKVPAFKPGKALKEKVNQ